MHGNYLEYEADIINIDTPILFGLGKMKLHRRYVNEVTNEFCSHDNPSLKVNLVYRLGHLYLEWPASLTFFSKKEVEKSIETLPTPEQINSVK